jgi:predicted DNA-binding protein YlxM (UPF0122 family)
MKQLTDKQQQRLSLYNEKNRFGRSLYTVKEIAEMEGVTPTAVYHTLRKTSFTRRRT